MTTSLYDLAEQVDARLNDFAFAERTAKVETTLTAIKFYQLNEQYSTKATQETCCYLCTSI